MTLLEISPKKQHTVENLTLLGFEQTRITASQTFFVRNPGTVIGEHLQDETGQILEYWRVKKADSVIILPIQNQQLILPPPTYRPGLGEKTLDFPGGRVPEGEQAVTVVPKILQRELGITPETISQLIPLNTQGWAINSSFSNQKLFSFVVELQPTVEIPSNFVGAMYPINDDGIALLLNSLTCLQCRAVLLEWWKKIKIC